MKQNILEVRGLTKRYGGFVLDNVSFDVPRGTIVGLIGENGAGKSTTIDAVLGLIQKDSGAVSIFGREEEGIDRAVREQIGVIFDGSNFSEELMPLRLNKVLRAIYQGWDEPLYFSLLEKWSIPAGKKIKTFSRGMKQKLSIAAAFSHHPSLLVLDEATSGLDPIVRDDILDMFLDFVQDENNSILVSSHITSDLEKVADYIVFLHNGRIIFSKSKDELIYRYGIIKCGEKQFHEIAAEDVIRYRKQDYEWQVLVADREAARRRYPRAVIDPAAIDEIMLLYVKGEEL